MSGTSYSDSPDKEKDRGMAFAIGASTYFNDAETRNSFLKTAEIKGHTVKCKEKWNYLLAV